MAKDQKKRQKILSGILVVILIAAVFWYMNKSKDSIELGSEEQVGALEKIEVDFSILDDSLFKSLKSHGILPVKARVTGKVNPFEFY
jgi:hypothetical protein